MTQDRNSKYVCYHCGYVFEGSTPPDICPECEEGFWLDLIEGKSARSAPVKNFMFQLEKMDGNRSVSEAAQTMREKRIGSIIVEAHGNPVGIVTERDMVYKLIAEDLMDSRIMLRKIMSSPVLTVDSETQLIDALKIMEDNDFRRLLVVENGKPVGLLTQDSILMDVISRRKTKQRINGPRRI